MCRAWRLSDMPTEAKAQVIANTAKLCEQSGALIFTDYRGLTVKSLARVRRQLKTVGAEYHVVKNTLFRRAFGEKSNELPEEFLTGPTAIAFVEKDEAACAKTIAGFMKEHPELRFKGGYLSGRVLFEQDVIALSKLPSKDELVAQVLSLIDAPLRGVVNVLNETVAQVVRCIGAIEDKKRGEAAA